jgi:hypothetical protein
MNSRTRMAGLVLSGLLLGFSGLAWPADSVKAISNPQVSPESSNSDPLLSILKSVPADANDYRAVTTRCKPSQLYSEHDVNGDPARCIVTRPQKPY